MKIYAELWGKRTHRIKGQKTFKITKLDPDLIDKFNKGEDIRPK